jgi:outer membrane protein
MITGRIIKTSLLIALLIQGMGLAAQKKYAFTVNEAVQYAVQNVIEIRNLKVDRKIQVAKNNEIKGQAMPQINGAISTTRFFEIPVTLLPDFVSPSVYKVLQNEGVKDGR